MAIATPKPVWADPAKGARSGAGPYWTKIAEPGLRMDDGGSRRGPLASKSIGRQQSQSAHSTIEGSPLQC
jgi:hypothetical protein